VSTFVDRGVSRGQRGGSPMVVKAERCTEFQTYKLKEKRSYRVVLKNIHYSINNKDIEIKIEKLGHTVTNT
jgi:hypothetical protein